MKRTYFCVIIISLIFNIYCGRAKMEKEALAVTATLTEDQKIGQMLMTAIPGTTLGRKGEMTFEKYLPGGIILFGYNVSGSAGTRDFIGQMQGKSMSHSGIPLFISIDQEGGRVKRVVSGVTQFPGAMASGSAGDGDLVERMARILGMELRLMGINMNLAPVLDVNNNSDNPVINIRSFGSDPALVSLMGRRYIRGLQKSLCVAVGKHFPGHGDTNHDSHHTLPVINYGEERLGRIEFPPFIQAIEEGVDGIMTAHIAYPEFIRSREPATLSREILTDLLRVKMKYTGIVFTDDMEMKGVSGAGDVGEAAVRSVLAGADVVLTTAYGESIGLIAAALKKAVKEGRIPMDRIDASVRRIVEVKLRYGIMTFDEKKKTIGLGEPRYGKDDLKLLEQAGSVNEEISRKSIYFQGDRGLLSPQKEISRIFITTNGEFGKHLLLDENDRVIGSERDLSLPSAPGGARKIVYYHVEELKPSIPRLKHLSRACRKNGAGFMVVSSGNPFPLVASGEAGSIILSFSDTPESLRHLALSLNGVFAPNMQSRIFLGLGTGR